LKQVWVFNGARNHFPGAVFTERHLADQEHHHFWKEEDLLTMEG
jgi:hypothetical protein